MLYHKTFELGPDRDWVVFVHGAGGSSSIWFKQLRAYRDGSRKNDPGKVMTDIAARLDESEMIAVAEYLSTLAR